MSPRAYFWLSTGSHTSGRVVRRSAACGLVKIARCVSHLDRGDLSATYLHRARLRANCRRSREATGSWATWLRLLRLLACLLACRAWLCVSRGWVEPARASGAAPSRSPWASAARAAGHGSTRRAAALAPAPRLATPRAPPASPSAFERPTRHISSALRRKQLLYIHIQKVNIHTYII